MPRLNTLANRLTYIIGLAGLDYQTVDVLARLKFRGYTGRLARGDKEDPRARSVTAIARVLGTSAEWLVDGVGPRPTSDVVLRSLAAAGWRPSTGHVGDLTVPAAPRKRVARSGRDRAARA